VGMRFVGRASATALIWTGSLTLGLADILYAGLVPGPRAVVDRAALALACAAGLVFAVALLRCAAGRCRADARVSRLAGLALPRRDPIAREAQWGIGQLEAWLARQDRSRDG
jgi:hypothetical protein